MNRLLPALLLLLCAAGVGGAAGMDVVAMVDTSASMFPYFDALQEYLLRDLLEHWLHKGDTFHLLSFADTPEEELSEPVGRPRELEALIQRIRLLQALGQYTDLVAAVDFLYAYLDSLPPDSPKLVLLLTDGVHDPPPASPNRGSAAQVLEALEKNADRIRLRGWNIHILRIPGTNPPAPAEEGASPAAAAGPAASAAPGAPSAPAASAAPAAPSAPTASATDAGPTEPAPDLLEAFAERSGADILPYSGASPETLTERLTRFPTIQFPGHLGLVGRRFTVPFTVTNPDEVEQTLTLTRLTSGRARLLLQPVHVVLPPRQTVDFPVPVRLPLGLVPGEQELEVSLGFAESRVRIAPQEGVLRFRFAPPLALAPLPAYALYVLIAAALVALAVLLTFLLRNRLRDLTFERFFGGAWTGAGRSANRRGLRPLVMKVLDQNPYIGTRNIHPVPPGRSCSVGGDGSTFLIYYLPMPKRIGDIRNQGKQYVFVPRKRDRFVSLDKPLVDCLDKEIEALSLRGQPVRFLFQEYVSPVEAINRLMLSVRKAKDQSASSVR